ncbi:hypothetical protein NVP1187O_015 [Vibrio phage 1.187.O._10N.286.49.F1]|nr:hypothetical protein NVP1187O_015 [Vibrio phage 1.187.O._10N.286.49.F1]
MSDTIYTPSVSGSGQFAKCISCGLNATKEGHDGCLGTLDEKVVMNACCGHGDVSYAYVQLWDRSCIRGEQAVSLIKSLKEK